MTGADARQYEEWGRGAARRTQRDHRRPAGERVARTMQVNTSATQAAQGQGSAPSSALARDGIVLFPYVAGSLVFLNGTFTTCTEEVQHD